MVEAPRERWRASLVMTLVLSDACLFLTVPWAAGSALLALGIPMAAMLGFVAERPHRPRISSDVDGALLTLLAIVLAGGAVMVLARLLPQRFEATPALMMLALAWAGVSGYALSGLLPRLSSRGVD